MPDSRLRLKIEGPGVAPDTVPLRDLLDLLDSYEQAVQAAAATKGGAGPALISLIEIGIGSDLLTMAANPKAMLGAESIASAINSKDCSQLPMRAEESLRQIWKKAHDRGWSIGLLNGNFSAAIAPDADIFTVSRVKGITSVAGQLRRIGGISPTAQILLDNNEILTVHLVGEDMAKSLGGRLYDFVALEGEATWIVPGWTIDNFRAAKILPITDSKTDAGSAFQLLADASHGVWDSIDPDSFVREHRDDVQQ